MFASSAFAVSPKEKVLYRFKGGSDGEGGLRSDKAGNLYGTTRSGGQNDNGSAFELIPPAVQGDPWTETTLSDFAGERDGSKPSAGLTFGKGGQLYGTTFLGRRSGEGRHGVQGWCFSNPSVSFNLNSNLQPEAGHA